MADGAAKAEDGSIVLLLDDALETAAKAGKTKTGGQVHAGAGVAEAWRRQRDRLGCRVVNMLGDAQSSAPRICKGIICTHMLKMR